MIATAIIPQDLSIAASPTFTGLTVDTLILSGATDDYKFVPFNTFHIGIENQVDDHQFQMAFLTKKSDGGDGVFTFYFATGTTPVSDPGEWLNIGYVYGGGNPYYSFISKNYGTGTVHPIRIETGSNTNQIYLKNDGTVGIGVVPSYKLDVNGTFRAAGTSYLQTIYIADNYVVNLGTGNDLTFKHDGANSYITNATGTLKIQSPEIFEFIAGTADTDLTFNFTGTTNSGSYKWMEDEDYFLVGDDILMNTAEAVYFRDTNLSIRSNNDGRLDIGADAAIDINSPLLVHNSIVQQLSGTKVLTDGVATSFVDIALAAGEMIGGEVRYVIYATDGTELQVHSGSITFAAVDVAGALTSDIDEVYLAASETEASSAGTLTDAWSVVDGVNKISIACNSNSSLTTPTITLKYTVYLYSLNIMTAL